MTLKDIIEKLGLTVLTPGLPLESGRQVSGAHASDLLSDVLANSPGGGVLLTIQVHLNVIAVALHAGLVGVIFTSGLLPDEVVRAKAEEEGLALFATEDSTFDAAGKLYALGLRGHHG